MGKLRVVSTKTKDYPSENDFNIISKSSKKKKRMDKDREYAMENVPIDVDDGSAKPQGLIQKFVYNIISLFELLIAFYIDIDMN